MFPSKGGHVAGMVKHGASLRSVVSFRAWQIKHPRFFHCTSVLGVRAPRLPYLCVTTHNMLRPHRHGSAMQRVTAQRKNAPPESYVLDAGPCHHPRWPAWRWCKQGPPARGWWGPSAPPPRRDVPWSDTGVCSPSPATCPAPRSTQRRTCCCCCCRQLRPRRARSGGPSQGRQASGS
jgi:hypothetical protein